MQSMRYFVAFGLLVGGPGSVLLAQETIIVPQASAPLRITSYEAKFQSRGRYRTKGIQHKVEYENISDQEIMATRIVLVSFSIFNKFLDRTGGIDMDRIRPGQNTSGTWVATAYADFSFHTGVAYVSTVRFTDGTIWEADLQEVTAAMQQIEQDFDESRLTAEERPRGGGNNQ